MKKNYMIIDGSVRKMQPEITLEYMQEKYPERKIEKCCAPPSIKTMEKWASDCGSKTPCGCWVEPDGHCEHGNPSWLLALGFI